PPNPSVASSQWAMCNSASHSSQSTRSALANGSARGTPAAKNCSADSSVATALRLGIETKTARIGVVGLGYVGLPLAVRFAQAGFRTIGLDTDSDKVSHLRLGRTYLRHLDAEQIQPLIAQRRLEPTDDLSRLWELDVILICVPTPLSTSRDPDLS